MPQAKTEVALQFFLESCAAEFALQHSLFCSADVIFTRSCAATAKNCTATLKKAALQESGAFLPLSCGFQAPTFRHPRLGPADLSLFQFFGHFFPIFCGRAVSCISPIFSYLGPEARNVFCSRPTGSKLVFSWVAGHFIAQGNPPLLKWTIKETPSPRLVGHEERAERGSDPPSSTRPEPGPKLLT